MWCGGNCVCGCAACFIGFLSDPFSCLQQRCSADSGEVSKDEFLRGLVFASDHQPRPAAAVAAAQAMQGTDVMVRLKASMWALDNCKDLAALFKRFDADGSDTITAEELRKGLAEAKQELEAKDGALHPGLDVSEADAAAIFKLYDADGSGSIRYDEFVGALGGDSDPAAMAKLRKLAAGLDRETVTRVFDDHDDEEAGVLDYGEVEEALQDCAVEFEKRAGAGAAPKFERSEMDALLKHFDKDGLWWWR